MTDSLNAELDALDSEIEANESKGGKKKGLSSNMVLGGAIGSVALLLGAVYLLSSGGSSDLPQVVNRPAPMKPQPQAQVEAVSPAPQQTQSYAVELDRFAESMDNSPANSQNKSAQTAGSFEVSGLDRVQKEKTSTFDDREQVQEDVATLSYVDELQIANIEARNQIKMDIAAIKSDLESIKSSSQKNVATKEQSTTKRMPGFSVVSASKDDKFAVVKTKSSFITLYPGEKVRTIKGVATVKSFNPETLTLLLSNGYFIDPKFVAAPAIKKRKFKEAVAKTSSKPKALGAAPSTGDSFNKTEIEGYDIVAVVAGGKRVMLRNKSGDIFRAEVGNSLEGYGSVQHINQNGDVIFKNHIIRKKLN